MFMRYYEQILEWTLHNKKAFLTLPAIIILLGIMGCRGFDTTFRYVADGFGSLGIEVKNTGLWSSLDDCFPGPGREFMPTINEVYSLLMLAATAHAATGET